VIVGDADVFFEGLRDAFETMERISIDELNLGSSGLR
jgi:hypothetical protein